MTDYPTAEPKLCWIGRAAQKIGCLPSKLTTSTTVYYQIGSDFHLPPTTPIIVRPVDSGYGYSDDIKYKPGPRLPSPQPDEPKPQVAPSMTTYQHKPPRVPKKTPVARTVPLSTLTLPVDPLPPLTPTATCVTINVDLPPVNPTANNSPYSAPLPAIPQTPRQNMFPGTILQDLGNIPPTLCVWNTTHGALTWTPAPTSHPPLHNPSADPTPLSPIIANAGNGDDWSTGLGLVPSLSSDSSDSSSNCPDPDHRFGITLHPFLASSGTSLEESPIEWNVSDHADMARYVRNDPAFLAIAHEPATNPPTNTLRIGFCFIDQPGVRWNWEPITISKPRSIRITDIFHAIHKYFQLQLTRSEYDIIKAYGKRNSRIVANSWRDRVSQSDDEAQDAVYHGGLRRVDCLGSCKNFAGLWVEGSQLKLGLRA